MSAVPDRGDDAPAPPPDSSPLDVASWALGRGLWPVPISPIGATWTGAPGKAPIGPEWGLVRPTVESFGRAVIRHPGAGVGLKLGDEGGVIDIDVDDPESAGPVLARMFPDGIPPTLGWTNADGKFHLLFLYDGRLAKYGTTIIKARVDRSGEITRFPEYLGLEIRIGAAPGAAKQIQSVVPPSLMADGTPRRWNGHAEILPLPGSVFADLDKYATPGPRDRPPAPRLAAGATDYSRAALAAFQAEVAAVSSAGEGSRNEALNTAAFNLGQLVPGGHLDEHAIRAALADAARAAGLGDVEIHATLNSGIEAGKAKPREIKPPKLRIAPPPADPPDDGPAPDRPADEPVNRTDLGNAMRLVSRHGAGIRHCARWGAWLVWDGTRWAEDASGEVPRLAKRTVRAIGAEAAAAGSDEEFKALLKWALDSESRARIESMIALAATEPGIPVAPDQLDSDPWALNVANGTIDLESGKLRPHRAADLNTKLAPVAFDPDATCPAWDAFLAKILPDPDLVAFVRRAVGYALTGDVSEHALFFLYGTGRNGKSTFLETLLRVLGDYGTTVDANLLTARRESDHPTGLTDLDGRRFVATAEVEDGKRMAEALVKRLTGGETIKARRMRQDFYEFTPTHHLFLAANHKPEIKGTDEGIWSRIKLIPFSVFIPPEERDRDLPAKLAAEAPGILAWCVRGCLEWQRTGLAEPAAVVAAVESYRAEMDVIGDFLAECCNSFLSHPQLRSQARVNTHNLYQVYRDWCHSNGLEALSAKKFGAEVDRRGYRLAKSDGRYYRIGLSIKPADDNRGELGVVF